MKKSFLYTLYLLILTMTSCTLSMEEFVLTEDQRGKDEPYTEVNEYGEFTYQYNDNVTSLNGEPQDYIAMMNDSVIWFMDNMPEKWIPKVDHYIAANCSKTVPLGLCAKVISVSREGGMIRVEHKPAEENEVFKQLEMRVDLEYVMPELDDFEDDSIATQSRSTSSIGRPGFWRSDSEFVDMSLFERRSRSDDQKNEEKRDTTRFTFSKTFDTPKGPLFVNLEYKSTDVVNVHAYRDLEDEYEEQWNDQYTERDIDVLVGYGKDKASTTKNYSGWPVNLLDIKGMKEDLEKLKTGVINRKKVGEKNITLPIPGTAFSIKLRAVADAGYTVMGYGMVKMRYRSETHRTGYIFSKGNKKEIDEDVANPVNPPYFGFPTIQFGGSIDFWLRGRVGAGLVFGNATAGVGAVVGLEIKGGLKASLETESVTDRLFRDDQNFKAGFYGTIGGFGEGVMNLGPFTYSLGDFTFMTTEIPALTHMPNLKAEVDPHKTKTKLIVKENEEVQFDEDGYPLIDPVTGDYITEKHDEVTINTELNFKKLETFFLFATSTKSDQRPALRIYESTRDDHTRKVAEVIGYEVLEKGKTYEFNVNPKDYGLSETSGEYKVVPCIYDISSETITEYQNDAKIASSNNPRANQPKCYQTFGREIDPYDFTYEDRYGEGCFDGKNIEDITEYEIETVVELKNASRITEWGFIYYLIDPYAKEIKDQRKEISMPFKGVCKSGKYTHKISFLSEYRAEKPGSGIGAPSVSVVVYYKYDGKTHFSDLSKNVTLQFPYER